MRGVDARQWMILPHRMPVHPHMRGVDVPIGTPDFSDKSVHPHMRGVDADDPRT